MRLKLKYSHDALTSFGYEIWGKEKPKSRAKKLNLIGL